MYTSCARRILSLPGISRLLIRLILLTALDLGKTLGLSMPSRIDIVAVEVEDVASFGDRCTPRVEKAIPVAAEMALRKCRTQLNF